MHVYESFYRFEKPPFKLVADPGMLFVSTSVREALGRLEYVVRTAKGLAVMTGEVGTGKTTLVNRFLDKAGPDLQTAYIFNPTLSGLQLLKALADELGIQTASMSKVDLTRAIYEILLRNRRAGRRTVVFVDEAQVLTPDALEELRLISNLETWQEKLLHIVLVGQPELLATLENHDLRQLRQRVELFIRIEPMQPTETRRYIEHRLRIANPLRDVRFTAGAAQLVHRLSAGVPREVNKLCDAALTVAYVAEATVVTTRHVHEAAESFGTSRLRARLRRARPAGRSWRRYALAAVAGLGLAALLLTQEDWFARPLRAISGTRSVAAAAPVVHLASFRDRSEAEAFATGVSKPEGRAVYLQRVERDGELWHRVFLGDFANLEDATRYAAAAQATGAYAYARPANVSPGVLESLSSQ
jgi:general secretion pathway protein A